MKYKEFKKEVEYWGKTYNYNPTVNVGSIYIDILFEHVHYTNTVCTIHKSERCVIDLNCKLYRNLSENAKHHLFYIIVEFAATPIEEREDEKSFIIPLPKLVTTDGRQQYLSQENKYNHKDCKFFASRRNETLRQIWKEKHLKHVPEFYRQFAEEFHEGEEY